MTIKDCGCRTVQDGVLHFVEFCPLHKAAPQMRDLLTRLSQIYNGGSERDLHDEVVTLLATLPKEDSR